MKRIAMLLPALCLSAPVLAGGATGRIASIVVADDSPVVLFTLAARIEGTPRCNEAQRFAIHLGKPGGMAVYTALLEAKRQGYEVGVEGLNTCTNEWKSEDVRNVQLY
jgi:hypothetical protein